MRSQVRVLLSPPNAQKTNQNGSFFIFLLVQKHSNMVVAPPAHHVCYDLLVTSGAHSSVQAHSLAITLTSFTTSLVVPTKCTKNEPKRFVFSLHSIYKTLTLSLCHPHFVCHDRYVIIYGLVAMERSNKKSKSIWACLLIIVG